MVRIALVNMPFAAAEMPSIALTQLKARLGDELGGAVECEVLYPNLDCLSYVGPQLYEIISNSTQANTAGLGDWFFSPAAFPELADDPDVYLLHHFSGHQAQLEMLRRHLVEKREGAGAFLDQLIDRHRLASYDLVGFTSMFCQNVANFAVAKRLKQRRPEIVTVVGGANCEAPMGSVIAKHVPWIDFVFSGPGLHTFPRFVSRLAAGEGDELHRITGVLSRQKLAAPERVGGREIGEELDIAVDVPLDYDDYFAAVDRTLGKGTSLRPKVPFETSRGCWWGERSHCTFCGLNGATMSYRAMPPEQALRLLHGLFARYSSRVSVFESVDNILPREYLTDLLPRLETPPGVALFYEVKADLKEREMAALARAGVTRIQPGIESIATTTLKLMRKGTTSFQNLKFLKYCQRYGVDAFWNLLIGFPNEPEEVYRKYHADLPLLTHLQPPTGVFPVRFDRFSPYHARPAEYGLKLRPCDFYAMVYPFPRADLEDFAYFFVDEDYEAQYLASTARWLGRLRERVSRWQQLWQPRSGRPRPELTLRPGAGAPVVYDSRGDIAVEHRLEPLGARILELLEEHCRLGRLVERLDGAAEPEIAAELASLQRRGLVFEEGGMVLSLVLRPDGEPARQAVRRAEAGERPSLVQARDASSPGAYFAKEALT